MAAFPENDFLLLVQIKLLNPHNGMEKTKRKRYNKRKIREEKR